MISEIKTVDISFISPDQIRARISTGSNQESIQEVALSIGLTTYILSSVDPVTGIWSVDIDLNNDQAYRQTGRLPSISSLSVRDKENNLAVYARYGSNFGEQRYISDIQITGNISKSYQLTREISQAVHGRGSEKPDPIIVSNTDIIGATFRGHKGEDVFQLGNESFSRISATSPALLYDFSPEENDRLLVSKSGLPGLKNPRIKIARNSKQYKKEQAKDSNIIYYSQTGELIYDSNGKSKGLGSSGGAFAQFRESDFNLDGTTDIASPAIQGYIDFTS